MRFSIWSFIRMFEMWFLTVFGLMCRSAAIWALSLPFAISFSTSISRPESSALIASAASGDAVAERVVSGGRLADDVDALLLEEVAQTRAEKVVIVDQEHAWTGLLGRGRRLDRFGHIIPLPLQGLPRPEVYLRHPQCNVIVTVRRPQFAASAAVGNQRSITAPWIAPPVSVATPSP